MSANQMPGLERFEVAASVVSHEAWAHGLFERHVLTKDSRQLLAAKAAARLEPGGCDCGGHRRECRDARRKGGAGCGQKCCLHAGQQCPAHLATESWAAGLLRGYGSRKLTANNLKRGLYLLPLLAAHEDFWWFHRPDDYGRNPRPSMAPVVLEIHVGPVVFAHCDQGPKAGFEDRGGNCVCGRSFFEHQLFVRPDWVYVTSTDGDAPWTYEQVDLYQCPGRMAAKPCPAVFRVEEARQPCPACGRPRTVFQRATPVQVRHATNDCGLLLSLASGAGGCPHIDYETADLDQQEAILAAVGKLIEEMDDGMHRAASGRPRGLRVLVEGEGELVAEPNPHWRWVFKRRQIWMGALPAQQPADSDNSENEEEGAS